MTAIYTPDGLRVALDNAEVSWELDDTGSKAFDEHEHPRDSHGRFTETPGGDIGNITPGSTEAGIAGSQALDTALGAGEFHMEPGVAQKIANVKEIGRALTNRAQDDPKLADALNRVGEFSLGRQQTAGSSYGGYGEGADGFTANDEGRIEGTGTPYQQNYLHLEPGMTVEQVGAAEVAARMQDTWMQSASDSNALSWGMQIAAARRVGIEDVDAFSAVRRSGVQFDQIEDAIGIDPHERHGDRDIKDEYVKKVERIADAETVKAYVDIVYNRTQEFLRKHDIKELTLFRGVRVSSTTAPGDVETVTLNPLSSFSTDDSTAAGFGGVYVTDVYAMEFDDSDPLDRGGVLYRATVPASRVFSVATTGPGCLIETEALVIGGRAEVEVVA